MPLRQTGPFLDLGPYVLTDIAAGPVDVDYSALGLTTGQWGKGFVTAVARTQGAQPIGVTPILELDGANPHRLAHLSVVPAPEAGGTITLMVYFFIGMEIGAEND